MMNELLIKEDDTLLQAMQRLDVTSKRVLFVVEDGTLIAAITDGDIRRWILANGSLETTVRHVANYNPIYVLDHNGDQAEAYMKQYLVGAIPIVDKQHRLISIALLRDESIRGKKQMDVPVVIMAGGLGTRLYPYTKILPKPLIPVGDLPIAEHIIQRFCRFGFREFYMIVNHKKSMIKAYFNDVEKDYNLVFVDEDSPLGTGGGLSLLKGAIEKTFIFSNCDIIIDEDFENIHDYHVRSKNLITMICSLKKYTIPYGIVEIDENGKLTGMREKPETSYFTNTGCYIVEPRVLKELESGLNIGFPEIVERYRECGEKIGVYPISDEAWMDMGHFDGMEEMSKRIGERIL